MLPHVAALYRYPVKGLSPQVADAFDVTVAGGLPDDRRFALALGTTSFDPKDPKPLDKGHFLMLRANASLAALATRFDAQAGTLSIAANDNRALVADLGLAADRAAVEDFFLAYLGEACRGQPRLVEADGHKFTDVGSRSPEIIKAISVINLASVRDLARRYGRAIDPLRFRGNVYVEGLPAWEELSWPGRPVTIGSARFRGAKVTKRCAAIDVDPATGVRDTNLVKGLMSLYGHPNCGIYLDIEANGSFERGAAIRWST